MSEGMMTGEAVYVQTNERENQVVVFVRAADGKLAERGRYSTGGAATGSPTSRLRGRLCCPATRGIFSWPTWVATRSASSALATQNQN